MDVCDVCFHPLSKYTLSTATSSTLESPGADLAPVQPAKSAALLFQMLLKLTPGGSLAVQETSNTPADLDPVLARRYVTQVLNFNEVSDPSSRALLIHGNHPYMGWAFKPKVPTPFSGFAPLFSSHAVSKQMNQ